MLEGKHSLGVGEIDRVHFSGLFHCYFVVVSLYWMDSTQVWCLVLIAGSNAEKVLKIKFQRISCQLGVPTPNSTLQSRKAGISRVRKQFPKNCGLQVRGNAGITIAFFYLVVEYY